MAHANTAYGAVTAFGEDFIIAAESQSCEDYDSLGGDWQCLALNPGTIYVDASFDDCPQHGTVAKPVTTIAAALAKVVSEGTLIIESGSYPEAILISQPATLHAIDGIVSVGN